MLIFQLVAGRQARCIIYLFYQKLLVHLRMVTEQGVPQPSSCPALVISNQIIKRPHLSKLFYQLTNDFILGFLSFNHYNKGSPGLRLAPGTPQEQVGQTAGVKLSEGFSAEGERRKFF